MSKRIHHMGMTLTKEEHDRFHRDSPSLNPKQHDALMKKLGITKEQDEEWHRTHLTLGEQRTREMMGMKEIHPLTVGGSFLTWCVNQDGSFIEVNITSPQRKAYTNFVNALAFRYNRCDLHEN